MEIEDLAKEINTLKMNVSMLMTLSQSHQLLINSLQSKLADSNKVVSDLGKPEPKTIDDVFAYLMDEKNVSDNARTLDDFIDECNSAIRSLPLQSTDDDLTDIFIKTARAEYESLRKKDRPFFAFRLTKRGDKRLIYKNRFNKWVADDNEVIKLIYTLEKTFRISQMNQLDIEDQENMTPDEQDHYTEYAKFLTNPVNKSKILKSVLDFADEIEL
jgi:hypothetical protein